MRWVFRKGTWKWLRDECGTFAHGTEHFASAKHLRQCGQTQMPPEQAHGFPDPQSYIAGGDLWHDSTAEPGITQKVLERGEGAWASPLLGGPP